MKYQVGFATVFALLLAILGVPTAFAQVPSFSGPSNLPGQIPQAPPQQQQQNPNPPSGQTDAPTSTQPNTTTPNATPAPAREVITWSVQALRDSLIQSIKEPAEKKKKKAAKKAHLSEEKVATLRSKVAQNEKDMKSRLKLAEHFEAEEDPEKTIETLRPALESLPRKGLLILARAYKAKKDYLQEVRVLEILLSQKEKDYFAQYTLGEAYASLGKIDEAMNRFEQAKQINERFLPPYEALLREGKRSGHLHDSVQTLQDMIRIFGDKPRFYSDLCLLYSHQAFLDKAEEVCKKAIAKDPKNPDNHVFLGLVIRDKDGNEAADKILKKAAQQFTTSELAQWVFGELSWERKNYPAALKAYALAVKSDPTSARSQLGLGRAAFEEKKYDQALDAFVKACKLNRNMIADFRKSAAILRRANNSEWLSRYEGGLGKCGLQ